MFDSETLLAMDYQALRRYTEEAVIERPSLFRIMRSINIKGSGESGHNARAYLAKKRCISAYIGVCDPINNNRRKVDEKRKAY